MKRLRLTNHVLVYFTCVTEKFNQDWTDCGSGSPMKSYIFSAVANGSAAIFSKKIGKQEVRRRDFAEKLRIKQSYCLLCCMWHVQRLGVIFQDITYTQQYRREPENQLHTFPEVVDKIYVVQHLLTETSSRLVYIFQSSFVFLKLKYNSVLSQLNISQITLVNEENFMLN